MTNAEKYNFKDFTRQNYRRLLRLAKKKYSFRLFTEKINDGYTALMRHDVDYSPQAALKLALIEKEEGIKATYFLLMHSEFYNLLEKKNTDCFKEILNHGHSIGLHFDCSYYNVNNESNLEKYLKFESTFLSNIFNKEIDTFSFHNPFSFELGCQKHTYAKLINTYSSEFHNKVGYCSDSNGYWRHSRLEDVISEGNHKTLQILTHPEWWQSKIMSPRERVLHCINGRSINQIKDYDNFLKKNKRKNIDW